MPITLPNITLSPYALAAESDLYYELNVASGTDGYDNLARLLINRATDVIEAHTKRLLRTRQIAPITYITEYHSLFCYDTELFTRDWPLNSVVEAREDLTRQYTAASTLLTLNQDFLINTERGRLVRIAGTTAGPRNWLRGFRAVRLRVNVGYATLDLVPGEIRSVATRFAALMCREITRQQQGIVNISDAAGNISRFSTAQLTKDMRDDLYGHCRILRNPTVETE